VCRCSRSHEQTCCSTGLPSLATSLRGPQRLLLVARAACPSLLATHLQRLVLRTHADVRDEQQACLLPLPHALGPRAAEPSGHRRAWPLRPTPRRPALGTPVALCRPSLQPPAAPAHHAVRTSTRAARGPCMPHLPVVRLADMPAHSPAAHGLPVPRFCLSSTCAHTTAPRIGRVRWGREEETAPGRARRRRESEEGRWWIGNRQGMRRLQGDVSGGKRGVGLGDLAKSPL